MARCPTPAILLLLALGCGGTSDEMTTPPPSPPPPPPSSAAVATVTVTAPDSTVGEGETLQLTATLRDADGNTLSDREISWQSGDQGIATVSASGQVTAVARGSTMITATSEGQSGTMPLEVDWADPPAANPELGLVATQIPVTVDLPTGIGINAADLSVWSGLAHVTPVGGAGTFDVPGFQGGPQMAMVVDAAGHPVLFGFLDPTATTNTLSVRSTAEVLAFFDMNAYLLQWELIEPMVGALARDQSLGPLEQAIAATLQASPHHLDVNAPVLDAARQQVAEALLASADPGTLQSRLVSVGAPATRSGITVEGDTLNAIVIKNDYRRRATAYIDQIQPPAGEIAHIDLTPTKGITSVFGTIVDGTVALMLGKDAGFYQTTRSRDIPVPLVPADATQTEYQVTVVGPGGEVSGFASLPAARQAEYRNLVIKSLFLDFFAPLITGAIIPMNKEAINAFLGGAEGASELGSIISTLTGAAPKAIEAASKGQMRQALFELQDALRKNPNSNFQNKIWNFFGKRIYSLAGGHAQSAFYDGAEAFSAVLGRFDLFLTAGDWVKQGYDIARSNQLEQFPVTVTPWQVTLTPTSSQIQLGGQVTLNAHVQNPPAGVAGLIYTFVTTGAHGSLETSTGMTGDSVQSSTPTVTYTSDDGTSGTDQVEVIVTAITSTSARPVIGAAPPATVEVLPYQVALTPMSQSLHGGEAVDFTVSVTPTPSSSLTFKYNTTGNYGSIFPTAGATTGLTSVTYTANVGVQGTDQVSVEVFDAAMQSIGTASATATVQQAQPVLYSGSWQYHQEFFTDAFGNPRVCIAAYITFSLMNGATSYNMHAHGFNDTAYWGNDIVRSVGPPFGTPTDNCGVPIGSDGSNYNFFLSGGAGPASGAGSQVAQMQSRFGGMVVDVTAAF